jgi:hypothetical protein
MFNRNQYQFVYLILVVLLLTLVSCSAPQSTDAITPLTSTHIPPTYTSIPPAKTPIPPTPTAQLIAADFEVTSDGSECNVSGPSSVPPGKYRFILNNLGSDETVSLWWGRLDDSHTFQDLLDLQSEPGVFFGQPSWLDVSTNHPHQLDTHSSVYNVYLTEEGEYSIHIGGRRPTSLWFCAPLTVGESPSE